MRSTTNIILAQHLELTHMQMHNLLLLICSHCYYGGKFKYLVTLAPKVTPFLALPISISHCVKSLYNPDFKRNSVNLLIIFISSYF